MAQIGPTTSVTQSRLWGPARPSSWKRRVKLSRQVCELLDGHLKFFDLTPFLAQGIQYGKTKILGKLLVFKKEGNRWIQQPRGLKIG